MCKIIFINILKVKKEKQLLKIVKNQVARA